MTDNKPTRYRVIKAVAYRDGVRIAAHPEAHEDPADAVAQLAALDLKAQPWEHYSIQAVGPDLLEGLAGPAPKLRDPRPLRLYAVKASPFPEGQEPEGYPVMWFPTWGRTAEEARGQFFKSYRGRTGYRVHKVKALTLEQEKALEAIDPRNEAARVLLATRYGEAATEAPAEGKKKATQA